MLIVSKEENIIVNIKNIDVLSVVNEFDTVSISFWNSVSGMRKRLCTYSSYKKACTAFSELINRIEHTPDKSVVYLPTEEEIKAKAAEI
ncbi:MAG: hypothetical protein LUG24_08040 [Clostridiales bacterium]|nr:hypothetical protein [Clostridiales bacterium]